MAGPERRQSEPTLHGLDGPTVWQPHLLRLCRRVVCMPRHFERMQVELGAVAPHIELDAVCHVAGIQVRLRMGWITGTGYILTLRHCPSHTYHDCQGTLHDGSLGTAYEDHTTGYRYYGHSYYQQPDVQQFTKQLQVYHTTPLECF